MAMKIDAEAREALERLLENELCAREGESTVYEAMAKSHPSLERGQVWCRECGHTQRVNSANSLQHGWPKCCGYTMTIDSPDEQRRVDTHGD